MDRITLDSDGAKNMASSDSSQQRDASGCRLHLCWRVNGPSIQASAIPSVRRFRGGRSSRRIASQWGQAEATRATFSGPLRASGTSRGVGHTRRITQSAVASRYLRRLRSRFECRNSKAAGGTGRFRRNPPFCGNRSAAGISLHWQC